MELTKEIMASKTAAKQDTRVALLEVGMDIMLEKGYSNTGIQEILSALQVPKGSFYHYFDSKENYAVEIIRHFDDYYTTSLKNILANQELSPLKRLRTYANESRNRLNDQACRKGCLIGNLSQEMSDQSEVLRTELSIVLAKRLELFAACIEEGQKLGEIKSQHSAAELADLFMSALSGAVMMAKTLKRIEPLDIFINIMIDDLIKA
jgi:TetR/AcrR family transcriptional repressor of nem operon